MTWRLSCACKRAELIALRTLGGREHTILPPYLAHPLGSVLVVRSARVVLSIPIAARRKHGGGGSATCASLENHARNDNAGASRRIEQVYSRKADAVVYYLLSQIQISNLDSCFFFPFLLLFFST